MNEENKRLPQIILAIIVSIVGFLLFKFVIFNDFTEQDKVDKNTSKINEEPALTLKADKKAQAELKLKEEKEKKEKQAEKNEDKDKDKSKDKDESQEKSNEKAANTNELKESAKDNASKVLEIQAKSKEQYNEESTQTLLNQVATKEYVNGHGNENKGDRIIKYKNVKIDIDESELKKDKPKGILTFDRLINPKDKQSKIKPSTEIDSKVSVTFKKEGNKLKVDSMQV